MTISRDAVEQGGAAAHVAGRERRVEHGAAIVGGPEPAGVFQAVHLGVQDGAAVLHAAVVAAADDAAIDDQHRADRNTPLGQPLPGFVDRDLQEGVHDIARGFRLWARGCHRGPSVSGRSSVRPRCAGCRTAGQHLELERAPPVVMGHEPDDVVRSRRRRVLLTTMVSRRCTQGDDRVDGGLDVAIDADSEVTVGVIRDHPIRLMHESGNLIAAAQLRRRCAYSR